MWAATIFVDQMDLKLLDGEGRSMKTRHQYWEGECVCVQMFGAGVIINGPGSFRLEVRLGPSDYPYYDMRRLEV